MKISYSEICINPSMPIKQAGFIQQTKPIYSFHDDLHARILSLKDENKTIHMISCDALGFPYAFQKSIQAALQAESSQPIDIVVSCTHTHFSADPEDPRFQSEVETKILNAIHTEQYRESDSFGISFQCVPFEGVGKSRISHHDATVLLQLLTIYDHQNPWIRLIIHNCHPTIHHGDTPYFTAEYPGYVIARLKELHEGVHFSFLQGAAGDVSTRFTRPSQDYEGVKYLGSKLVDQIEEMSSQNVKILSFNEIAYDSQFLKLEHELRSIDLSQIRSDISEREKDEIQLGAKVNAYLNAHPERLQSAYMISGVRIGTYHLVFCPSEAFSCYIDCIDSSRTALVCYSNGYGPYMTGIHDDFITYESFTDTLTEQTKMKYMEIIKKEGNI